MSESTDTYHVILNTEWQIPTEYFEKAISTKAHDMGIQILFQSIENNRNSIHKDWFYSQAVVSLDFTYDFFNDFIQNSIEKALDLFELIDEPFQIFENVITETQERFSEILKKIMLVKASVYYKATDGITLHFIHEFGISKENSKTRWQKMLDYIKRYETDYVALKTDFNDIYLKSDNMVFLLFKEEWLIQNPALSATGKLNEEYRLKNDDKRIAKPKIIMNETNYSKYFVWDHQWKLDMEGLPIIMARPNDIALYQNLMEKSLTTAKDFFELKYARMSTEYYTPLISKKATSTFYDYFENIISAAIFAYTSIEALANICIADGYEHIEEKGGIKTVYSKEAIERKFTLRDKFKQILQKVLNTTDPTLEDWWQDFLKLEEIRNEIIHTKSNKSELRYSEFLDRSIFRYITVSKRIISYYGHYVNQNKRAILEDFPFDFGFDNSLPLLMTNDNYENSLRILHNIPSS